LTQLRRISVATYDIVTIGGAALAKGMAERGYRVRVVERETQFRDRVRGEFVFPWGVAESKQLGVYDQGVECGRRAEVVLQSGDRSETVSARLVIGADGRASLTRKWGEFASHVHPPGNIIAGVLLQECARSGLPDGLLDGARQAVPLASFDGADTWVDQGIEVSVRHL
jgi:2-polyprenyl-6-methoxyphenol hydroxylase-like FAD-dependent oxidoreductase